VSRFVPRPWVLEVEFLAMHERSPYWATFRSRRVRVEGATGVQPHQDLGTSPFQSLLETHGIVTGVEDEQVRLAATRIPPAEATHQRLHLLGGHVVGVLLGWDAPCVYRRDPGIALEAELCNQLVAPSGHDGLAGGVAAGMVVIPASGARLGVTARPCALVYRVDPQDATGAFLC